MLTGEKYRVITALKREKKKGGVCTKQGNGP